MDEVILKLPDLLLGTIQADSALLYYEIPSIIKSDKKASPVCIKEEELDPVPYFHASLIHLSITFQHYFKRKEKQITVFPSFFSSQMKILP